MTTIRAKGRRFLDGPGFAYLAVIAVLLAGVYAKSTHDASAARRAQIEGCERGKLDRADHARVYGTMANYYDGVTKAASVKADVKRIATMVRGELRRSARGMRSRILVCVPLVDDDKRVPDRQLLSRLPQPVGTTP